jgi:hypothetical protein
MEGSIRTIEGGGYEVAVPWRPHEPHFLKNQSIVKWMTEKMECKLYASDHIGGEVDKTFKDYLDNNFIKKVPRSQEPEGYYITWFCVVRPEKETTKVRTVFNCAQTFGKNQDDKKCLNDGMYTGPKLHNELFDIILRMRQKQVFIGADISKFYMRIRMAEQDQEFHRFYWRGTPYQFTRWPFGNKAAPFAALYVVQNHIKQYGSQRLQDTVLPCMYMDDILFSVDTVEEAKTIIRELREVLLLADMPLSKWVSSHPEALVDIPKEEQSKDMFLIDPDGHNTLGVGWKPDRLTFKPKTASEGNLTRRRIASIVSSIFDPLGWLNPCTLEGRVILQGVCKREDTPREKERSRTNEEREAYDNKDPDDKTPVINNNLKILWDTDLDKLGEKHDDIRKALQRFRKWELQLPMLDQISYTRRIYKNKPISSKQLHVFTDGSKDAYAAMAYIRIRYMDQEVDLVFLCCVRRITPWHGRSTPETELMGAVTGAEVGKRLSTLLDVSDVRYWTDSTPVLTWIRKAGKKNKVFVVHRTTAIHDLSDTELWDYVPTGINPADLPTRGCTIEELRIHKLYWRGPGFITEQEDKWPHMYIKVTDEERFPKDTILLVLETTPPDSWITQCGTIKTSSKGLQQTVWPAEDQRMEALVVLQRAARAATTWDVTRFSRWARMLRAMTRVKGLFRKNKQTTDHLDEKLLMESAATLISMGQVEAHKEELKHFANTGRWPYGSPLEGNQVYLDKQGIMRVSSRAQLQPDYPLASKFPIWFPKKTWVGALLLKHEHDRNHYKTTRLAMDCMAKFYCNGLTQTLKSLSKQCMNCQKRSAKPGAQIMSQLPDRKLGSLKQFSLVSMDACGHFTVKILNSSMKVWVLVIACLQTKAVHLEVIEGLKTEEVINALERMVARRGQIEEMHADNFASFIAAKTIITKEQQVHPKGEQDTTCQDKTPKSRSRSRQSQQEETEEEVDLEEIQSRLTAKVWKWTFSKPYSSEGNGVAEAMVKLTKEAMHTTFRHADIRINEFRTVVAKAEARVNSRPVATFRPNDCWENIQVLTPMHFSHGHLGGEVAPEADIEDCRNLPKRWALMQKHFTKYAKELNKGFHAQVLGSHKWAKMVKEIKIGTLVLIMSDNEKRYNWPLGLVTEVHRSKDGIVRAVAVRTKCLEGQRPTTVSRNVRELIPLSMFENTDEPPHHSETTEATTNANKKNIAAGRREQNITEDTTEAARNHTSVGTAKVDSHTPSTTKSKHPRTGRHHHERPRPWGVATVTQQSAATAASINTEATIDTNNKIHVGNHNMEVTTRWTEDAEGLEPIDTQKTPESGALRAEVSGSDNGHGEINNKEIPNNTEKEGVKTYHKTPTCKSDNNQTSGNEILQQIQNTQKSPESETAKEAKSTEETPEIAMTETTGSNNNTERREEEQQKQDNLGPKTPKTKYKTEVEKLLDMQVGLGAASSKRRGAVTVVTGQETNQCESTRTENTGDGPKTGIAE